jgi:hypothetical protein
MNGHSGFRVVGVVLSATLVAGCASENPREGGFIGGVAGLSSGTYDERIYARQGSLEGLKAARTDLESEQVGLESKKSASQRRVQSERNRLAKLTADTRQLSARVKTLKAEDVRQQGQIADLKQRAATLEGKLEQADRASGADALEGSGSGAGGQDARQQQLENQRRQLEDEYRLLNDMYRKLGS